jgi:hypothetical protein
MKYRDFFESANPNGETPTPSNVDPAELEKGIEVEKEHTKDRELAKRIACDHLEEDPHYYSKLSAAGLEENEPSPQISMPPGGMGQSVVGGIKMPSVIGVSVSSAGGHESPQCCGDANKEPGDKEPITAAGKFDTSAAQKSVGGEVAPGEGQEQGGPNTQGTIEGTPKNNEIMSGSSPKTPSNPKISGAAAVADAPDHEEAESPEDEAEEEQLREAIKREVRSILKEMIKEGAEQFKVRDGASQVEQPGQVMRARVNQYDSTVNEVAPPGFPQDLEKKLKKQYGSDSSKAYKTMWALHNKGQVKEVVEGIAAYKANAKQPSLRTQDTMHARTVQQNPEVTEAAYKVQGKSSREFEDSPQFPKAMADPKLAP